MIELMMYQGGCKMIGVARSSQKISSAPPLSFHKTYKHNAKLRLSINIVQTIARDICSTHMYEQLCLYFVYIFYISLSGHLLRGAESYIGQFRSFCRLQLVLRFPVIRYPSIALCLIIIGIYIKSLLAW